MLPTTGQMSKPNQCTMALKAHTNTFTIQTNVMVTSMYTSVKGSAASIKTKFGSGENANQQTREESNLYVLSCAAMCTLVACPH